MMTTDFRENKTTTNTIEQIGVPKDIKKAIIEYIWNGYDAGATEVDLSYNINENLGFIEDFNIRDNGSGIVYEDLEKTFTPILDSQKKAIKSSFYTRGKKGKGRFSFISFCGKIEWATIYELSEKKYGYNIKASTAKKNGYLPENLSEIIGEDIHTGTNVSFLNLDKTINKDFFESNDFLIFLKSELAWFLHLHKNKNFKFTINGNELEYSDIILDDDLIDINIECPNTKREYDFKISYILWKNKIGEDSQNYYLDQYNKPRWNEDNKTNKKSDGFYNSLYVVSNFFNTFEVIEKKAVTQQGLPTGEVTKYDNVFKLLSKSLTKILHEKRKKFLLAQGNKLIEKLYNQEVMPSFGKGKYEQLKKDDFEEVVKEIYIFEPQIFEKNTNHIQKKTILAFLKELLDDNKREHLLKILQNVLDLDTKQVKEFSNILEKIELNGIINLTNLIIDRKELILKLEKLVFDLSVFTNERDHIQKIVENNYWLFGEQYNMVTADKNFKKLESEYLKTIGLPEEKVNSTSDRRPDIFMIKDRKLTSNNPQYTKTEHIIVELKRPSQNIGSKEYRQIEDYMEEIKNNPTFNGKLDYWKFYIISNKLESFVTDKYISFEKSDDPFLVGESVGKYKIYALTWKDLFSIFENNHQYLIDGLNIDDDELIKKLDLLEIGRKSSDNITKDII